MVNARKRSAKGPETKTSAPPRASADTPAAFKVEVVDLAKLRPHPKNYKKHPEAQLEHIVESLREHGFYKNIVVASDGTILAGHGVVEAARKMGIERAPVRRLDVGPDDPLAMKVLAADNELGRFAESDDRMLTEMLRGIAEKAPNGLLGTGYDEQMLAALVMVTRPESEIQNFDAAAEWIGMPDFEPGVGKQYILTVQCLTEKDRAEAAKKLGVTKPRVMKQDKIWTGWYPEAEAERKDLSSLEWRDSGSAARPADDGGQKKARGAKPAAGKANGRAKHANGKAASR